MVGGGIGRVVPRGVVRTLTGIPGTSSLILEDEERLVIADGVFNASAILRLCRCADALLSLNRVRVEVDFFKANSLMLGVTSFVEPRMKGMRTIPCSNKVL